MSEPEASPAVAAVSFDDLSLVRQAQAGDAGAFAQLVAKYQGRVYNVCLRISGHSEDARDLTQEVFLRAYSSIGGFRHRSSFYTWLFRVATNVAISHQRQVRRTVTLPFDPGEEAQLGRQARGLTHRAGNPSGGPAERLSRREADQLVVAALLELDEQHRAAVVLRDVEGLDYQQIAEVLQVAVGTVKSRLHRARKMLRERLSPLLEIE